MKVRLILFIGALVLGSFALDSCKDKEPYVDPVEACFAFPVQTYKPGELISFTNCSQYAYTYRWSFGDGSTSQERHAQHAFDAPGTYQVVLTAYGETDHDEYIQQVVVEATTSLDLLVMYYLTEDPVSYSDVTLYGTEQDWYNFENPIVSGQTDLYGSIIFDDLMPVIYYIDAYKAGDETLFYSNENLGNATDPLEQNEINYYNVYVELLQNAGAAKRQAAVIKRIEKTTADDKYRRKFRNDKSETPVY